MSFFLQAFKAELRSLLRSGRMLLLLLLLPLCVTGLGALLPGQEALPAVPVGWAMPENCVRGEALLELLRTEDGLVQFIPTDPDTLRENVAAGKWECGFILRDDFDARVEKQRWPRLFTLVRSESSTMHTLVSEAVSSAMLGLVADEIGGAYLEKVGAPVPETGWTLDETMRLEIIPACAGELGLEPVAAGLGRSILSGCAAILLTVLSLAMGDSLSRSRKMAAHRRLAAVRGEWALLLPALACRFFVLFVLAELSLLVWTSAGTLPLLALCLRLTALMALLSFLPDGWSAPLLPFVPPLLLVLCPVLFDIGALLPALEPVCALFGATHYLRGSSAANLAATAVYALGAWAAARLRRT